MSQTEQLIKVTDSHIQNVFGQYDVFMKKMERTLHVSFVFRDDCLKIICEIVGQQQYTTWFKPIRPVSLEDAVLTLEVPSNWFMEYIESAYLDVLRKTLHRAIGEHAICGFVRQN